MFYCVHILVILAEQHEKHSCRNTHAECHECQNQWHMDNLFSSRETDEQFLRERFQSESGLPIEKKLNIHHYCVSAIEIVDSHWILTDDTLVPSSVRGFWLSVGHHVFAVLCKHPVNSNINGVNTAKHLIPTWTRSLPRVLAHQWILITIFSVLYSRCSTLNSCTQPVAPSLCIPSPKQSVISLGVGHTGVALIKCNDNAQDDFFMCYVPVKSYWNLTWQMI